MKRLNQPLQFLSGLFFLTICSTGVAKASVNYVAQAEADIATAQYNVALAEIEAAQAQLDAENAIESAEAEIFSSKYKQSKTPFVGQLFFDFVGANATMKGIEIDKKGHTIIEGATGGMPFYTYVIYEGEYSQMMPIYDGESYYTIIGKNAIAVLDSEGNLRYGDGCDIEEGKPCVTNLFIPD